MEENNLMDKPISDLDEEELKQIILAGAIVLFSYTFIKYWRWLDNSYGD